MCLLLCWICCSVLCDDHSRKIKMNLRRNKLPLDIFSNRCNFTLHYSSSCHSNYSLQQILYHDLNFEILQIYHWSFHHHWTLNRCRYMLWIDFVCIRSLFDHSFNSNCIFIHHDHSKSENLVQPSKNSSHQEENLNPFTLTHYLAFNILLDGSNRFDCAFDST